MIHTILYKDFSFQPFSDIYSMLLGPCFTLWGGSLAFTTKWGLKDQEADSIY